MSPHPFDRYAAFTDLSALKAASVKPLRKSFRVNTLKSSVEQFKTIAGERGWQISPVPWCPEAFYIEREDRSQALGKDLLHLLGHVYMQEAASMLPPALLDPQPGEVILDMSAAPGSKTTQMAARMQNTGVIICNDVQEKRLWTLKTALHRSGVTNNIVTKKVGQWFAKNMTERFDRVLCDAPCTAQGTSRKDSDALIYCSDDNIGKMAKLQRELLESAVHACKVGGRIVYSTCTLTPEENEEVVRSILNKFCDQLEVVDPRTELRITNDGLRKFFDKAVEDSLIVQNSLSRNPQSEIRNLPLLRLWPQTFDTEGFFCAVLKKTAPTRHKEKFDFVRFQEELLPPARQKDIAKQCEELYGTSFLHDRDQLFLRADQIIIANEACADFKMPVQNYALGIPFARKLEGGPSFAPGASAGRRIRLQHEIITLRGQEATKNVLELSEKDVDALLDGKDISCPPDYRGDPILKCGSLIIGTSLAQNGMLKNRLPRWVVAKS
ncbi:NOL1/NOP2/sun family putative RNA methylase [Candidatus Peribacteria bacterium]|nr:NOL1/NOP2/sun family putative RNA methylase [Candidatus Peribacteria bacterium]